MAEKSKSHFSLEGSKIVGLTNAYTACNCHGVRPPPPSSSTLSAWAVVLKKLIYFFLLTFLGESKHRPNPTVSNSQKIYEFILFAKQRGTKS